MHVYLFFRFMWWIEVLVVFEKKTNKIKIDRLRKTRIKETLMESKRKTSATLNLLETCSVYQALLIFNI